MLKGQSPIGKEGKSEEKPKDMLASSSSSSSSSLMRTLSATDDEKRSVPAVPSSTTPVTPLYRIGKEFVISFKARQDITIHSVRLANFKIILRSDEKNGVSNSISTRAAPIPNKKLLDEKEIKKITIPKDLPEEDEKKESAKSQLLSFPIAFLQGKINYKRGPLKTMAHWVGANSANSPAMQPIFKFFVGLKDSKEDTNLTLPLLLKLTNILVHAHIEAKDSAPSKNAIEGLMQTVAELAGIGSMWIDCFKLQAMLLTLDEHKALNIENLSGLCQKHWDWETLQYQLKSVKSQIISKPEIASIICQQTTKISYPSVRMEDVFSPALKSLSTHSLADAENVFFTYKSPDPQMIARLFARLNFFEIFTPNQERLRKLPQERLSIISDVFAEIYIVFNDRWRFPKHNSFLQIISFDSPKLFPMMPYIFEVACVIPEDDLYEIVGAYITLQNNNLFEMKENRDLALSSPIAAKAINRNVPLLKGHPMMPVCLKLIAEHKYELSNMLGSLNQDRSIRENPTNCTKISEMLKSSSCVFMATIVNSVAASGGVVMQEEFNHLFDPATEKYLPALADLCTQYNLYDLLSRAAVSAFIKNPQHKEDYISLLRFAYGEYLPYFERFYFHPEKIKSALLPTLRFLEEAHADTRTAENLDIIFKDFDLALARARAFEFLRVAGVFGFLGIARVFGDTTAYIRLIHQNGIYVEEAAYGLWLLTITNSPITDYKQVSEDAQYRPFLRGLAHGMLEIYREPSINNPTSLALLCERKEFADRIAMIACAVSHAGFMSPKNFETICDCASMQGIETAFLTVERLTQNKFDELVATHKKLHDSGVIKIIESHMISRDRYDRSVLGIINRYVPPVISVPAKPPVSEESEENGPRSSPENKL